MKTLWAPWRIEYIENSGDEECIFCAIPSEKKDSKNLLLERGELCFSLMNRYPYNNGHIMIAPYRHIDSIVLLTEEENTEMYKLLKRLICVMNELMNPQGYNIGFNMGKTAGAGFDGHIHMHIVPRWNGDTNFMPVIADTKVMPEYIEKTYKKILAGLKEIK